MKKNTSKMLSKLPLVVTREEAEIQLMVMVQNDCRDWVPTSCPAYAFSETADQQKFMLETMRELGNEAVLGKGTSALIFVDEVPRRNEGYPGADKWVTCLLKMGLLRQTRVVKITCAEPLNTFTESLALVEHMRGKGHDVLIVAPTFHLRRAYRSVLGAMKKLDFGGLRVYARPTMPQPWFKTVAHSQGTLVRTPADLVVEETRRERKYCKKGDLVSVWEALNYLRWRNACRGIFLDEDLPWSATQKV